MTAPGLRELKNLSAVSIDFHVPAVGFVRHIAILRPDPQRAVAESDRGHFAEVVPLAQILSIQVEALQPGVVAIRHIDDSLIVDSDPVRLVELSRTRTRTAPLPDAFALGV